MQDAVVFAEFNHQGGPRGGDELVVPNWWMGMATRNTTRGRLTFTGMLRLRPPAGAMGRMWNMRMSQPMQDHGGMPMGHAMP